MMGNEEYRTIYITGDTHGDFLHIKKFAKRQRMSRKPGQPPVLCIVLGDAGLNFYGDEGDTVRKERASKIPMTFLCVHGNHEMRPYEAEGYELVEWQGGLVYRQEEFPRLLFAKEGEIYRINGISFTAIGGACSVDKAWRLRHGHPWFASEQPDEETKKRVEEKLEEAGWNVDAVLSHTCPLKYVPEEAFLPGLDQTLVDRSTEEWLDTIEDRLDYRHWYCGHFHINKNTDRLSFLYHRIVPVQTEAWVDDIPPDMHDNSGSRQTGDLTAGPDPVAAGDNGKPRQG